MAESMRNISVAYTKGVRAAIRGRGQCPYGSTKLELVSNWYAGYNDAKRDLKSLVWVDVNMCSKTLMEGVR